MGPASGDGAWGTRGASLRQWRDQPSLDTGHAARGRPRVSGGFPRLSRAHQTGAHYPGDRLTKMVRPAWPTKRGGKAAGRLRLRRGHRLSVIQERGKHGKSLENDVQDLLAINLAAASRSLRGCTGQAHEKGLKTRHLPGGAVAKERCPNRLNPHEITRDRRYLPVGRTSFDVMPTATFITDHLCSEGNGKPAACGRVA